MSKQSVDDPYRITTPVDIHRIMQDILNERRFVTLALSRGHKVLTMLLHIDGDAGYFLYDAGRTLEETRAMLASNRILFSATLNGVSVRFTASTAVETEFDGAAALRSPLPSDMQFIQRREHYRTKVIGPSACSAKLPDGTPINLKMTNLSLGGVKLESTTVLPESLPVGLVLRDALLDLFELGNVSVDLLVSSHQKIEHEGLVTHLYGCKIQHLPRSKEAAVQRLVFSLELLNRPNTRSRNPTE
ncbi:MAG TPA: flagellar brake protein [Granulicella sp.]|nr:flagellar brake protein [Granulicella sp.]